MLNKSPLYLPEAFILNISMAKNMGMTKEEFLSRQALANEEKNIVNTNFRLQCLELSLQGVQDCLNEIKATVGCQESEFSSHKNEVLNSIKKSQKHISSSLGDYRTEINEFNNKIEILNQSLEKCVKKDQLESSFKDIYTQIADVKNYISQSINDIFNCIDREKSHFQDKIKMFKDEIESRPTGIEDLKNEIKNEMKLIDLNGQNSVIRSSNNEKNILLIERKIDNIYQLIKKLELTIQVDLCHKPE